MHDFLMASILLIDDDDLLRGSLARGLMREGHDVSEAGTGREGLRRYSEERAELVITDLVMPDTEGIETILGLKSIDKNARIIAMSGGLRGAQLDILEIARRLGAMKTIAKPFELKTFLSLVKTALEDSCPPAV